MTREEIMRELNALSKRIFSLEKKLSDFTDLRNTQCQSDIDYIAMETGVDLDQEEVEDE